jgi:protoporphyrinogen oxidase
MHFYKAKIRLAGSTMNEVEKILSAPELLVLQYIHGVDAVVGVSFHEQRTINLREEKGRLKGLYDQALIKREQSIDTIFGPLGSVPEQLPADLVERFGMVDEDDVISVAKNVTAMDKRANHSQTMTQNEQENMDRVIPAEEVNLQDLAG